MNPDVIVPVSLFASFAIIFWKFYDTRHKENMAMIERGITSKPKNTDQTPTSLRHLTSGLLAFFVSIGFIAGIYLSRDVWISGAIIPALMIMGAGIGLLCSYAILSRYEKRKASSATYLELDRP